MGFFQTSTWIAKSRSLPTLPKCGACGLLKKCQSPKMPVAGSGKRKILFVGEAPGQTEDEEGVPFVGEAGQLLQSIIKRAGLRYDDCWYTNAAICRPPKNKIEDLHIESCRPNLTNTIKALQPKVIILLGLSAVKSLVGLEWKSDIGQMSRWVGWQIPSTLFGAWLCPTYHPSFLLRMKEDQVLMRMTTDHIESASDLEDVPHPVTSQTAFVKDIELITDTRLARKRLRDLATKEGRLAFDYETSGLKPERPEQFIYTASFCLEGADTFACRIDESCHAALSAVLLNPKLQKIASNLKFEERWTINKLGHGVEGWLWDVMLAAHVVDNRRGITSIKFQSYVQLGYHTGGYGDFTAIVDEYLTAPEANGMNRIKEAPLLDLLRYNGLDSRLEYMVAMQQMKTLGMEQHG